MRLTPAILVATLGLACGSCGTDGHPSETHPLSAYTPKDVAEAENIALYLSGSLIAPEELYRRVVAELSLLRGTFGAGHPAVLEIGFWPPWDAGRLDVIFDESTRKAVADGSYSAWDQLNDAYDLEWSQREFLERFGLVTLGFHGRLHPRRLQEEYQELFGVRQASPHDENPLSDFNSNLYPGRVDDRFVYLFDDCSNFGIDHHYRYFTVESGRAVWIGEWRRLGSCLDEHHEECSRECLASCTKGGAGDCQESCESGWVEFCRDDCPEYFQEPSWWPEALEVRRRYRSS